MTRERTLMVPGNHDRFSGGVAPIQRRSFKFEELFDRDEHYPKLKCFLVPERDDVVVAFFLVNSIPVPDVQLLFRRRKMARLIAGGYVPPRACARLVRMSRELEEGGHTIDIGGRPVDLAGKKIVRVALLHHHPIPPPPEEDPKVFDHVKRVVVGDRLEQMAGSEMFVEACFDAKISLVLFGHKHRQFDRVQVDEREGRRPVHFLCCPSTLQYETKYARGFYSIAIDDSAIRVTLFCHDVRRNAFVPQTPMEPILI